MAWGAGVASAFLRLRRNRRAVDEPLSAQLRALLILRAPRDEKFSATEADSTEADLAKADLQGPPYMSALHVAPPYMRYLKVRPTCPYLVLP